MKNVLSVLALIVLGVAVRLTYRDIPNFAAVASLALFAGYLFRERRVAVIAPLAVLLITDAVLGGYNWLLMSVVYSAALLPVWWGALARRWRMEGSRPRQAIATGIGLASIGIGSSIIFFVVTNFATWVVTPWYDRSFAGLALCYARGLEFFRYTLAGDLCFGLAFFGGHALILIFAHAYGERLQSIAQHDG